MPSICTRHTGSTPIRPLQSLFPFLRPLREKLEIGGEKWLSLSFTHHISGLSFSPPVPLSRAVPLITPLTGQLPWKSQGKRHHWQLQSQLCRETIPKQPTARCRRFQLRINGKKKPPIGARSLPEWQLLQPIRNMQNQQKNPDRSYVYRRLQWSLYNVIFMNTCF